MNGENNLWVWTNLSYDNKLIFNLKCPRCGTIINNYMKYCYECGKQVMIQVNTYITQSKVKECKK